MYSLRRTPGVRSRKLETYTLKVSLLLRGNFLMCVCLRGTAVYMVHIYILLDSYGTLLFYSKNPGLTLT